MFVDFLVGCITIILVIVFIPLLWFVFHLSIMIAIPLGIVIGIFFGLVVIGKLVRYARTHSKKGKDLQETGRE